MDLGIRHQVAVVTGGASGIGTAVALALAAEGCDVAIVDRRASAEASAVTSKIEAAGRRSLYLESDVRDPEVATRGVATVIAAWGRLDILVCCAGITADAVSWKMTPEQWDAVLGVNLTGCFYWNRAAARAMKERGGGTIVNFGSINGLRGKAGQANYAASKAGVVGLSKTLARELGRYGVRVNVVAPGFIRTAMTAGLAADVTERALSETVLGRLGDPEDCASVVAFLCSPRAAHVTGQVVRVDGGQYL